MIPFRRHVFALFVLASMFVPVWSWTQTPGSGKSMLVGDWRGESICVAREGACHDEQAFYHVADIPDKPGDLAITFSKVVDNKTIKMGTLDCQYDSAKNTATCVYPIGRWDLQFKDNEMNGTLTLTDKTLFRRVKLKKEK